MPTICISTKRLWHKSIIGPSVGSISAQSPQVDVYTNPGSLVSSILRLYRFGDSWTTLACPCFEKLIAMFVTHTYIGCPHSGRVQITSQ